MNITHILSLALTLVFAAALTAPAQTTVSSEVTTTLEVKTTDYSAGTVVRALDGTVIRYGYSFVGNTAGTLPGSIVLSMNTVPSRFREGTNVDLNGGSFVIPVYLANEFGSTSCAGSIFGRIDKGSILWSTSDGFTAMEMTVTGGTGRWAGTSGRAYFEGRMSKLSSGSTAMTGNLKLSYFDPAATQD